MATAALLIPGTLTFIFVDVDRAINTSTRDACQGPTVFHGIPTRSRRRTKYPLAALDSRVSQPWHLGSLTTDYTDGHG